MDEKNQNKTQTTIDFVDISEIRDDILVLKNGSLRALIEVGSINFELKSQDEQTAIITAFQDFLNSIDFPLQIVIHSRKLDITPYIENLNRQIEKIDHELLRIQAIEYERFVSGLTELTDIMSKKFYIVAPFYLLEAPVTQKGILGSLKAVIQPSKVIKKIDDIQFETYKIQLMQRVELIYGGLMRIGLNIKLLKSEELEKMFSNLYSSA